MESNSENSYGICGMDGSPLSIKSWINLLFKNFRFSEVKAPPISNNIIFDTCVFYGFWWENCTFNHCQFLNCIYNSSLVWNNTFNNCKFSGTIPEPYYGDPKDFIFNNCEFLDLTYEDVAGDYKIFNNCKFSEPE